MSQSKEREWNDRKYKYFLLSRGIKRKTWKLNWIWKKGSWDVREDKITRDSGTGCWLMRSSINRFRWKHYNHSPGLVTGHRKWFLNRKIINAPVIQPPQQLKKTFAVINNSKRSVARSFRPKTALKGEDFSTKFSQILSTKSFSSAAQIVCLILRLTWKINS